VTPALEGERGRVAGAGEADPRAEVRDAGRAAGSRWPIVKYEDRFPKWNAYGNPHPPPRWRLGFLGMNGPGMTEVTVAFSRLPSEEARKRFKQKLIKDVAMLDFQKGAI
jgi:hypothetical protein